MTTAIIVGQNMPDATSDRVVAMHDRIVIFEPLPDAAAALRHHYKSEPKVIVVQAACGVEYSFEEFRIYNEAGLSSSLGTMTEDARDMWRQYDLSDRGSIVVMVVNLLDTLYALGICSIDCLVIDAQGMDFTILKTVAPMITIGSFKYIQLEADGPGFRHYTGTPDNGEKSILEWMAQFPHYEAGRLPGRAVHHPDLIFTLTAAG
jgi:FkbM family methyltransferase